MEAVTSKEVGLFPAPKEIKLKCSCPDSARMCKHIAATLYGVGNRLDHEPEMLFLLRGVKHEDLITQATQSTSWDPSNSADDKTLLDDNLESLFGIELDLKSSDSIEPKKSVTKKKVAGKKKKATLRKTTKTSTKKKKIVNKKVTPPNVKRRNPNQI